MNTCECTCHDNNSCIHCDPPTKSEECKVRVCPNPTHRAKYGIGQDGRCKKCGSFTYNTFDKKQDQQVEWDRGSWEERVKRRDYLWLVEDMLSMGNLESRKWQLENIVNFVLSTQKQNLIREVEGRIAAYQELVDKFYYAEDIAILRELTRWVSLLKGDK